MTISELKDYVILITSDEPYSKMWHTQLIYTEYLSKSNTVYYINPPKKWEFKNVFRNSLNKTNKGTNLTVLNYINKLPVFFNAFNVFNEYYNEKKIAKELKTRGAKKVIIWHFDSYRSSFSHNFFDKSILVKRIYHVIDPFYKNPIDRWLCKISDLVIITSPRNNRYYSDFTNKMINVSQSLDIDLQKNLINSRALVWPKLNSNYFVLLGTLSDDIDFDWLLHLLENQDFRLVIIGKVISLVKQKDKSKLVFEHPHVEYLGLLSPQEFYPILKHANAGLIIYNEDRRSKVCSPLKALNYIVSELPVITNIDCEIHELLNNSIYYANTIEEADNLIETALRKELKYNSAKNNKYVNDISLDTTLEKIIVNL